MPADPSLEQEHILFAAGVPVVIGVDEVGRGAMAGPVCVGVCAIEPGSSFPRGLRDSKLLSARRRAELYPVVRGWGMTAVGHATADEIDQHGITACLGLAAKRALVSLHESGVPVGQAAVLLDGAHDWLNPALVHKLLVTTLVKADQSCASVAAASVVAKVERDELMSQLAAEHPAYGWDSNKGYGSATHMSAIRERGVTEFHRKTWVKSFPLDAIGLTHDG